MKSKNVLLALIVILMAGKSYSQKLQVSLTTGNAIGEMKYLKKQMLFTDLTIAAEFRPALKQVYNAGIGMSVVKFDNYDTALRSVFNERTFLNIPLKLKHYVLLPHFEHVSLFGSLGITGSLNVQDKKEIREYSKAFTEKKRFTGFNVSYSAEMGAAFNVSTLNTFSLAVSAQNDFVSVYKESNDKIRLQKFLCSIAFLRQL